MDASANKMWEARFWKIRYRKYIRACRKNAFFDFHRNRHREHVFRNQRAKWRRMVVELSRFDRFLIFLFSWHMRQKGEKSGTQSCRQWPPSKCLGSARCISFAPHTSELASRSTSMSMSTFGGDFKIPRFFRQTLVGILKTTPKNCKSILKSGLDTLYWSKSISIKLGFDRTRFRSNSMSTQLDPMLNA